MRVFNALRKASIEIACDIDPARLPSRHARRVSLDWREAVSEPSIDAVVVATPASSHYTVTRAALAAGKHVLVEKPMTTRVDEGETLLRMAESAGLVLMVGHIYLFNRGLAQLKERISTPGFGPPAYLHARRTHNGPVRGDVNVVWDLASHDVAIFNHLVGALPTAVSAVALRHRPTMIEEAALIRLWYPGGIRGQIHVSWVNPIKVREITVVGKAGFATLTEKEGDNHVRLTMRGAPSTDREPNMKPHPEPLKEQCRHFLACIGGARQRSGGDFGVGVVTVLAAIDESLRRNGYPVTL